MRTAIALVISAGVLGLVVLLVMSAVWYAAT